MQARALRRLLVVGVMLGAAGALLLYVLVGVVLFIPLPAELNDDANTGDRRV
jgi:hypothetical protein